jgi:hypothetical protein
MAVALNGSEAQPIVGLTKDWTFVPSDRPLELRLRRALRARLRVCPAPAYRIIKPLDARPAWLVYFVFAPDGELNAGHRYTLQRLKDEGFALFIVCATAQPGSLPQELGRFADALYWKALSGYDFSAYAIALHAVGAVSPGASVTLLNDSVLGPFHDLRRLVTQSAWDLTGFTASSLVENHVQSYGFVLRDVTPTRLAQLGPVLPLDHAFDRPGDVILCQETALAAVAARHMSVGAHWFSDAAHIADPTLVRPFDLLALGFPFVKKSLLAKHANFQDRDAVIARLEQLGHPPV